LRDYRRHFNFLGVQLREARRTTLAQFVYQLGKEFEAFDDALRPFLLQDSDREGLSRKLIDASNSSNELIAGRHRRFRPANSDAMSAINSIWSTISGPGVYPLREPHYFPECSLSTSSCQSTIENWVWRSREKKPIWL
jgi:hypothetical protein